MKIQKLFKKKVFVIPFAIYIILWILTASIGIKAVQKEHEAFLKFIYEKCKEGYKKNPKIGIRWSTPQMGISPHSASFWKRKLFKEKQYPTFEEWRKFHATENSISYFSYCPFLIESKRYQYNIAWQQESYFWYFWGIRKYKHKILAYID